MSSIPETSATGRMWRSVHGTVGGSHWRWDARLADVTESSPAGGTVTLEAFAGRRRGQLTNARRAAGGDQLSSSFNASSTLPARISFAAWAFLSSGCVLPVIVLYTSYQPTLAA
jgi:hypothetical protein